MSICGIRKKLNEKVIICLFLLNFIVSASPHQMLFYIITSIFEKSENLH